MPNTPFCNSFSITAVVWIERLTDKKWERHLKAKTSDNWQDRELPKRPQEIFAKITCFSGSIAHF